MNRLAALLLLFSFGALAADDDPTVFKSDVAMTRVDAQVVDAAGRPITGLQARDFVLRVDGKPQPVHNFLSENMPVDVLLLLDVSGSMQPHIQRIADASETALRVLAPDDRVAIMLFDTRTRLKLPFASDPGEISRKLHSIIQSESFNGGTRITQALVDAARYIQKQGRPDARRAIVILTDDETQDAQDEPRVEQSLDEADAVLSFLRAPYAEDFVHGGGRRGPRGGSPPVMGGGNGPWGGGGGSWPGGGSPWPGGGSPMPGSGGSRLPGGVTIGHGGASHSAGTADIATDSGGDVMPVDGASAFEDTLARLRQRYALHFYWPASAAKPEERIVAVALSRSAGSEYPNAQVRYRRAYIGTQAGRKSGTLLEVSREADSIDPQDTATAVSAKSNSSGHNPASAPPRRRIAVNEQEDSGPVLINTNDQGNQNPDPPPNAQPQVPAKQTPATPPPRQGWPEASDTPQ
ncbi:MAG TPA: VWA domain-containing protein [Bryobacteraceae bacterium]|nr:VWA domain-containing protein [Bryobacteraceae bacterium]